jgi:CBS domain containing-hemolysin-like protein
METELGDPSTPLLAIVAAATYAGAMLMAGLLTAFFRVSGLHRHGLLVPESAGRILSGYLQDARRFFATISTLHLGLTILSCLAWQRLLVGSGGMGGWRFLALLTVGLVLAWTAGGLACKRLAATAAVGYVRWLGALMYPLYWLLRPWSTVLLWLMNQVEDTLWAGEALPHLSAGEIRSLLEGEDSGVQLEEEEREMIHSIFSFHDTAVREIMVPRIDMVSLEAAAPVASVIPVVNEAHHSRIPVHEGSVDRVTGILYAKDLLALIEEDRLVAGDKVVGDLARPAYFIPESKKIDEVLAEFRTKRIHMGIVIDEYGGTAGLVTLEDVLEEIVGEIEDEFDITEQLYTWLDERSLRIDPKIDLEDLSEAVGVPFPEEASETLGGLIYEAAGKVPEAGEQVTVAGFTVTVEEVADNRILLVTLTSPEPLPGFARWRAQEGA